MQKEALQLKLAAALEAKRKQDEQNKLLAADRKKAELAAAAVSTTAARHGAYGREFVAIPWEGSTTWVLAWTWFCLA